MSLTPVEERVLVGVSLAATRRRLERVAGMVLDRDDAVTELVRACAASDDGAWEQAGEILERRKGDPFNFLDLVVEVSQQEQVCRGEPRTWTRPR
jgi:hypothetical protein